jgi:fumarate reductase flavoprotein subunit
VVVLEKRKVVGGNSVLASVIFHCPPDQQDDLFRKTLAWHRGEIIDPLVLRAYINKSEDSVDWLRSRGVELYGAPLRIAGRKGLCAYSVAVARLKEACRNRGVEVIRNARCDELLRDAGGRIAGVRFTTNGESREIATRAVILATGGFTGDPELLKKYFPFYDQRTFKGHMVKLEGDGIGLAQQAGAALYDSACMVRESCQTFTKAKYHMPLVMALRRPDIVVVNKKGDRIIDESFGGDHPSIFSNILVNQPEAMAYAIYDQDLIDKYKPPVLHGAPPPIVVPELGPMLRKLSDEGGNGILVSESLDEVAAWIGADAARLKASVEKYNRSCAAGYDDDFVKDPEFLRPLDTSPYYVIKFTVLMIDTIGPLKVNSRMEVVDRATSPIPGLYAAGVLAGGWTSHDYCQDYMFGSCMGWSVSSGRIAGENAARHACAVSAS